jgi:hypothetical protein
MLDLDKLRLYLFENPQSPWLRECLRELEAHRADASKLEKYREAYEQRFGNRPRWDREERPA